MLTSFFDKNENRVRWGYLTAFILLFISLLLTFYSSQQVSKQQERLYQTNTVINTLDILSSELISAESAFRGYLLLKDEDLLSDYYKAPHLIDSTFLKLKTLTADNDVQQKRLDTLQVLIKSRLNILSSGLRIFKNNNLLINDTMKMMGHNGKLVMDTIKTIAEGKMPDLNCFNIESAMKMIAGTARTAASCGSAEAQPTGKEQGCSGPRSARTGRFCGYVMLL